MVMTAKRAWAAAGTVALAAAVNVTTGALTQHWAVAWWAATIVLVVVGGGLQAWLTAGSEAPVSQSGGNDQLIERTKVGGSVRQSRVRSGEQIVRGSEVQADLVQEQRDALD